MIQKLDKPADLSYNQIDQPAPCPVETIFEISTLKNLHNNGEPCTTIESHGS